MDTLEQKVTLLERENARKTELLQSAITEVCALKRVLQVFAQELNLDEKAYENLLTEMKRIYSDQDENTMSAKFNYPNFFK